MAHHKGSDSVMDPLKMTYGVKNPLDSKTERIQELLNQ
jgi:hypothetical protein